MIIEGIYLEIVIMKVEKKLKQESPESDTAWTFVVRIESTFRLGLCMFYLLRININWTTSYFIVSTCPCSL